MKSKGLMFFSSIILALCLVCVEGCKKSERKELDKVDCSKINSSFSANIKPIIDKNCLSSGCHNTGSVNGDFTTYAGIKAKVDNGSMESRVIERQDMPLSGKLSLDDLKKIKCWLNSGATNN